MNIFASRAFLDTGWASNVRVTIEGTEIETIRPYSAVHANDVQVDTLLPALSNLHSHSFQRAMAGMTEFRTQGRESFWTWRKLMYAFLDRLTPDHISAIAAQSFMEMQKVGFAAVGEFHYLHNEQGGQRYGNAAELSDRIMQAAVETGIGLTHLPVLYTFGDVGEQPLAGGQHRFGNTYDEYAAILESCKDTLKFLPDDATLGVAPH